MLKSRAFILSGSNRDNESQALRQTGRPHTGPESFSCISFLPQYSPFAAGPSSFLCQPAPFFHPGSPFSTSSPVIPALYLPSPPPPTLSSCLLSLPNLYPPPTSNHMHAHKHTHTHKSPSCFLSDIDKWRLTEMTTSLLIFNSDTSQDSEEKG